MKELGWACGAFLIVACGGRADSPEAPGSNGASGFAGSTDTSGVAGATSNVGADAGAPGVGPIDSTNLAKEFPDASCRGPLGELHLALPCKVGMPLGGTNAVECYDTSGQTALTFAINLETAASSIGKAIATPSSGSDASALVSLSYASVNVNGVQYRGVLHGSVNFEQVDPNGRAFVAFLTREFVAWTDPSGTETDCEYDPMRLWATAGGFL